MRARSATVLALVFTGACGLPDGAILEVSIPTSLPPPGTTEIGVLVTPEGSPSWTREVFYRDVEDPFVFRVLGPASEGTATVAVEALSTDPTGAVRRLETFLECDVPMEGGAPVLVEVDPFDSPPCPGE